MEVTKVEHGTSEQQVAETETQNTICIVKVEPTDLEAVDSTHDLNNDQLKHEPLEAMDAKNVWCEDHDYTTQRYPCNDIAVGVQVQLNVKDEPSISSNDIHKKNVEPEGWHALDLKRGEEEPLSSQDKESKQSVLDTSLRKEPEPLHMQIQTHFARGCCIRTDSKARNSDLAEEAAALRQHCIHEFIPSGSGIPRKRRRQEKYDLLAYLKESDGKYICLQERMINMTREEPKLEREEPKLEREERMLEREERMLAREEWMLAREERMLAREERMLPKEELMLAREERKLVREERKLAREERKLSREERKLSREERKLSREERKLARLARKLARLARKLAREKRNLARLERKLAREERNLARLERKLAREERKLAREELKLAREEWMLAREERKLAREERKLAREELKLAREELKLARVEWMLAREERKLEREE